MNDASRVIVIGASAGGVGALKSLLSGLTPDLCAPVLIVIHVAAGKRSFLDKVLARMTSLPVRHAVDGESIVSGTIYIAPPDFHMLIAGRKIKLAPTAKENGVRPAIDPLFRSAALEYGDCAIGVVLSGLLYDGTAGLISIKRAGGISIAQDPEESEFPSMPANAISEDDVDFVKRAKEIGPLLDHLCRMIQPHNRRFKHSPDAVENMISRQGPAEDHETKSLGEPSRFVCPDCGGILWEINEKKILRYKCRTGHGYTYDGLAHGQALAVENALWTAVRALQERADLLSRLAAQNAAKHRARSSMYFSREAENCAQKAGIILALIQSGIAHEEPLAEPMEPFEDESDVRKSG